MSQSYVNQLTINCLVNKEMINKHVDKKKLSKEEKEEIKFYRKRTYNLFKELINGTPPQNLLPDVKYAYDNFVKASIHYFKTADNNDIIQAEYDGFESAIMEPVYDLSGNTWIQRGQDIDGEAAGDQSGTSVAISSDGNTVAIGAPLNDGGTIDNGQVRVYLQRVRL
jgi:hypothetical protein